MFVCCAFCIWWVLPIMSLFFLATLSWLLRHAIGVFVSALALCIAVVAFGDMPPFPLGPPDPAKAELGKLLFFDRRLSQDGTIACASCHQPNRGWSDGRPVAIGINGRAGTRNSPTIINAVYSPFMFHDGRVAGTPLQALLPLGNPDEMASRRGEVVNGIAVVAPQNSATVVQRLRIIGGYVARFSAIFPIDVVEGSAITEANLGDAIDHFERTIVSDKAPIDRFLAGDKSALSADARVGYNLAKQARCFVCHLPPLFTDNLFHNTGLEQATMLSDATPDQGRFVFSRDNADRRKFKTPTLREINRTAPYGHNGAFADLARVVRHYNAAGAYQIDRKGKTVIERDPNIDPLLLVQHWDEQQEQYVVRFLKEAFAGTTTIKIVAPTEFPQ